MLSLCGNSNSNAAASEVQNLTLLKCQGLVLPDFLALSENIMRGDVKSSFNSLTSCMFNFLQLSAPVPSCFLSEGQSDVHLD